MEWVAHFHSLIRQHIKVAKLKKHVVREQMIKGREVRDKIGEEHPREKNRCKEISIVEGERRPMYSVSALLLNVLLRDFGGPTGSRKGDQDRAPHRSSRWWLPGL